MKFCSKCKIEKPENDFALNNSKSDGRQTQCRLCKKTSDAEWYQKNKSSQIERNKKNALIVKKYTYDYLTCHPCIDCGETDPVVLEFDHIDRSDKSFTISEGIGSKMVSLVKLQNEINKCVVRCANCHRRKTSIDGNHYRSQMKCSPAEN